MVAAGAASLLVSVSTVAPVGRPTIQGAASVDKSVMVVLARAVPGQEQELWDWYINRHLPDLLAVPGLVRARIWRISTRKTDPASKYDTMSVYDLEGDAGEIMKEAGSRMGGPQMPTSPALEATLSFTGPPNLEFTKPQVDRRA